MKKKSWMELYLQAKEFYDAHGYFPSRKDDHQVYIWARWWWKHGGPEKYPEKADMLTAIGFQIISKEKAAELNWWNRYLQLKQFYDEHGHFPSWKEMKQLHRWATNWSSAHGSQEPEKMKLLEDIGYKYMKADDYTDYIWMKNYNAAKVYFEEHGIFPSFQEEKKLFLWAKQWWRMYYLKNPEKNKDKAELLKTIGFEHRTLDDYADMKWMKNYEECKAFYEEHGRFPTNKDSHRLYAWVTYWYTYSYQMKPERNQEKADMLAAIGFEYNKKR